MEVEDIINSGINIHLVIMGIFRKDGMQGVELIKLLKNTEPMASVIVQTALSSIEIREKCFDSGCDVFFLKPWSCTELLNSVQKYCACAN
jgi:CheY-like chemotaxis protein